MICTKLIIIAQKAEAFMKLIVDGPTLAILWRDCDVRIIQYNFK